jgi:hypothetical protein
MFLPIRLTWNLQMPKVQKMCVFVLFGSGFICIAFATLRIIQLGIDGRGETTTPEPKWMLLWTVLECSIGKCIFFYSRTIYGRVLLTNLPPAIVIGCSPAFAVFIRKRINSSKTRSYNAEGYLKQPINEDVMLKSIVISRSRHKRNDTDVSLVYWNDAHSSQEVLAKSVGRIDAKSSSQRDDEHSSNLARAL